MGGHCPGGYIVRGDVVRGDVVPGAIVRGGGYYPGGYYPDTMKLLSDGRNVSTSNEGSFQVRQAEVAVSNIYNIIYDLLQHGIQPSCSRGLVSPFMPVRACR